MAVRPAVVTRKLVIIEEGLILSMASTERFFKEFPVLRQAQPLLNATSPRGRTSCGNCLGDPLMQRDEIMSRIKMSLAGMPDDRRRLLATMLNAKHLRIIYRQGTRLSTINFP